MLCLTWQVAGSETGAWEGRPSKIAYHYFGTWFTLDLISILASLLDIASHAKWFGGERTQLLAALR